MLFPHQFETTVQLPDKPRIIISQQAYNKMWHYIDKCDLEIGWLGVVERDGLKFTIRDVFLPKQEITCITTTITKEGLQQLAGEILERPDGMDIWNNMLFWGHSHVEMSVGASTTDDEQMELFMKNKSPYFIRGIFNKKGSVEFTLFMYQEGYIINDVPWSFEVPLPEEVEEAVQAEMDSKLKKKHFKKSVELPEDWFERYRYKAEESSGRNWWDKKEDEDKKEEDVSTDTGIDDLMLIKKKKSKTLFGRGKK